MSFWTHFGCGCMPVHLLAQSQKIQLLSQLMEAKVNIAVWSSLPQAQELGSPCGPGFQLGGQFYRLGGKCNR